MELSRAWTAGQSSEKLELCLSGRSQADQRMEISY